MTGAPSLPQSGGYLDQDAELMLAFELLEEMWTELEKAKEAREKALGQKPAPLG